MKLEILGCYGSAFGKYRTTSFMVNNFLLIDCGTITEVLEEERIKDLRFALLSHTHIDHVKALFPLLESFTKLGKKDFELISEKKILKLVCKHYLNNYVWPDFTSIPSEDDPFLKLREIERLKRISIENIEIEIIPVNHTVYTTGFLIKEGERGFMFTADTGKTESFFEIAKEEKGIEFIIADVSYPDRLKDLAQLSGHMTPSILVEQIEKFGLEETFFYISHIKPPFLDEVLEELARLKRKNVKPLRQGSSIII